MGALWIVGALEKIAVVEHAAREMQVELVEEIALRDRRINSQEGKIQAFRTAASELARQNANLKQELACVTEEMLEQQAAADNYSALAGDYAETIDVGVLWILGALEKIAVVEHGAREAQVELLEEIELKEWRIKRQEDEAQALRQAHEAALARIAVLEVELDKKRRDQQEQPTPPLLSLAKWRKKPRPPPMRRSTARRSRFSRRKLSWRTRGRTQGREQRRRSSSSCGWLRSFRVRRRERGRRRSARRPLSARKPPRGIVPRSLSRCSLGATQRNSRS
ncbi:hypothetical protein B0H11DRAFT_1961448 [Mycena galericulata]|nr:hypothetical protein B0H11DRAFT_1961448 [Mycena galericulata]